MCSFRRSDWRTTVVVSRFRDMRAFFLPHVLHKPINEWEIVLTHESPSRACQEEENGSYRFKKWRWEERRSLQKASAK